LGRAAAAGGFGTARGGAGGARIPPELDADADGAGFATGAATTADCPGNGLDAGFGLEVVLHLYRISAETIVPCNQLTLDGPPARNSLPWATGRTTPGFFFAGGRDKLDGGSPEGT